MQFIMSKIIFLGDSFTWGQGLYFYKWRDEGRKFDGELGGMYDSHSNYVTIEDVQYKDNLSYTGLVSSYYNLSQSKRTKNGGSNTDIVLDMLPMIDRENNDIDKLVFQFTTISRYFFRDLNMSHIENVYKDGENRYIDDIIEERAKNFFNYIDGILKYFSKLYKFEYCYLDWLGDFYQFNPDKFVTYNINEKEYKHFNPFLEEYKIDMFVDNRAIIDLHLNKEGQQILSKGIINYFNGKR
jgi:hypothetical protein